MRSAKVAARGCSLPLQRVITDFAADQPFAQMQIKLREHYGFEIGESTIQRITLCHARSLHAQTLLETDLASQDFPETAGRHKEIIAQTDGGMIPIVTPDQTQKEKRKGKTLSWREGKLCLAHAHGWELRLTLDTETSKTSDSRPIENSGKRVKGAACERKAHARRVSLRPDSTGRIYFSGGRRFH